MTLTVRLGAEEERVLREAVRIQGRSQSEIVREAIVRHVKGCLESARQGAQERLGPWLGCVDSGGMDLSVESGRKYRELMRHRLREARPD